MSSDLAETRNPWQQVADAINRASALIEQIPGWGSYQCAPETDLELRLCQRRALRMH